MSGYIAYEGPSQIDGKPIIGIVTFGSTNTKTGDVNSLWILVRDHHPVEADNTSICGSCPLIGNGCYVIKATGSSSVWKAYQRGLYTNPRVSVPRMIAARPLRLGADGDPGALPVNVLDMLLRYTPGHLGYTHQWRRFPELRRMCMASVHSEKERLEAKALGFRTYRTGTEGERPIRNQEAWCPASNEMEHKLQCTSCMVCSGLRGSFRGDVFIRLHGSTSTRKKAHDALHDHKALHTVQPAMAASKYEAS